jgi:hypothetical protein
MMMKIKEIDKKVISGSLASHNLVVFPTSRPRSITAHKKFKFHETLPILIYKVLIICPTFLLLCL